MTDQITQRPAVRLPLPPGDTPPMVRVREYNPQIAGALDDIHAASMLLTALDPLTTEVVRLRCAQWHDCRVCKSLRLGDALTEAGTADPTLSDRVADFESSDLDERRKVALRLTEAFVTDPAARIDAALAADLRSTFSTEEIVEILLDIISWTQQKVLVPLALDTPMDELRRMDFDAEGHPVIGGAV